MTEELKKLGNEALQNGNFNEAISFYSKAIDIDSSNHILFSNRSAAYCKAAKYAEALSDADDCLQINSNWAKGHLRRANALEFLERYDEALESYETALKLDPNNASISKNINDISNRINQNDGQFSFDSMFNDPRLMEKLSKNEVTKEYLKDPSFISKMDLIKKNPKLLQMMLQDKQIMDVVAVCLGVDPGNIELKHKDDTVEKREYSEDKKENSEEKSNEKDKKSEISENEKLAIAEKDKGNEAYKAKKFDDAIGFYTKAIELQPSNCTFYTNLAAVYYEQGLYEKCIELCNQAVEVGRENRADYKLIAKGYSRSANAYFKMGDLQAAKKNFEKSLSEHRVQEIVKKLHDVELKIKEKERLEKINPEEAEKEKILGNTAFQKGKYPDAMKHYNEAISRNPDDPKIYCNRAACYTKLLEFPMAIKDCDTCIKLDPTFVKGYLRKAACLVAMKDHSKAADVYRKALDIDPNCAEAHEGLKQTYLVNDDPEEARARAMQDPEIQEILGDPAMQIILGQMQKDPAALKEHLQNPVIAQKLQKLMEKGFIAIR